jgi:hypothetical protein
MRLRSTALLPLLACLALASSAQAPDTNHLRDQRYCEILLGSGGFITPTRLDVYNTIGLDTCPQDLWSKITVDSVKKETGAKFVRLNGPRHWTLDNFVDSKLVATNIRSFGGVEMREAGVLEVHVGLLDNGPYHIHTVARTTVEHYKAGLPVFQLIDPTGAVYFMQSYSLEKDPSQTMAALPQLGSKLHLPKGWQFRTLILKHDYYLKAINNQATVVQDDLINTYQKSTAHGADDL